MCMAYLYLGGGITHDSDIPGRWQIAEHWVFVKLGFVFDKIGMMGMGRLAKMYCDFKALAIDVVFFFIENGKGKWL